MDSSSDFPVTKSPRRELQGPRPTPLKVRKDSHKIKKPPLAPQPFYHPQQQHQQAQPRQPVIIYTVSPKIIHTNPSDFMNLVQRLTGSSSTSCSTSAPPSTPLADTSGAISPAARFATMEKAIKSPEGKKMQPQSHEDNISFVEGIEMGHGFERSTFSPGILSPAPTALPPIPPNFFSPVTDPNSFSFFHDLSPVFHGNRNFMEGSFMPSPSSFLISPNITSPTPSIDLFNNFFDI